MRHTEIPHTTFVFPQFTVDKGIPSLEQLKNEEHFEDEQDEFMTTKEALYFSRRKFFGLLVACVIF